MVDITKEAVANALHLDGPDELPPGAEADMNIASRMVGNQVAPYIHDTETVQDIAVLVACAFIEGTEDSNAISGITRETASVSFDTASTSSEAQSYWERAKALDTSNRLGRATMSFQTHGSQ